MARKTDAGRSEHFEDEQGELLPVLYARTDDEAAEYCDLLNDHDIPACVGSADEPEGAAQKVAKRPAGRGVPVFVPESLLDEASEIIADRDEFVDFEEDAGDEEDEEEESEFTTEEVEYEGDEEEQEEEEEEDEQEQEEEGDYGEGLGEADEADEADEFGEEGDDEDF